MKAFCFLCTVLCISLPVVAHSAIKTFVTDAAIIEHATQSVTFVQPGIQTASGGYGWHESEPFVLPPFAGVPFVALAVEWSLQPGAESLPGFEWRGDDGEAWNSWQLLSPDPHLNHASARRFSTLVFAAAETEIVQVRARHAEAIDSVVIHAINPGETETALQEESFTINDDVSVVPAQITRRPPWVNRTSWGNPFGQNPTFTPRYTSVSHMIVHHTATPNEGSNHDWPAVVRSIWSFHVNTRGWDDIGYNYLIDPNGVLYEGRAGGDNVQGAHFSCANGNTMGVALLGTFTAVLPTEFALGRLADLCAWKASVEGLDVTGASFHSGTGLMLDVVSGHRDGNSATNPSACPSGTVCPGTRLYRLLPQIRETARQRMDADSRIDVIHLHE